MRGNEMRIGVRWWSVALGAVMLAASLLGMAPAAHAGGIGDTVQVHGYGSWSYRRLRNPGYYYNEATRDGNYTNVSATLNVAAQPTDQLLTVIQANWRLREDRTADTILLPNPSPLAPPGAYAALPIGTVTRTPISEIDLDYAFAEWTVNDAFKIRAGQVKLPFGLYTEIWDVGTLRPFLTLPQGIYGNQATVAEAYQGGGITGVFHSGDWSFMYDLYVGQVTFTFDYFPTNAYQVPTLSDVFGGRISVFTPVEGLSMGISGYFGLRTSVNFLRGERATGGVYVDFTGQQWTIRAEGVMGRTENVGLAGSAYGEIAYKITENIQVAGRFDYYHLDFAQLLEYNVPTSMGRHRELTGGLNYWFSPNFVIKSSYSFVYGNRFSLPENFIIDFLTPIITFPPAFYYPDRTNHVFMAGAQFSF